MPREVFGFVFRGMAQDGTTGMYIEAGREYQNGQARRSVPRAKPVQPDGAPKNKVTPEWLKDNYPRLTANLDDERRAALAAQVQLPVSALEAIPIGWWPDRQWWDPESKQFEGKPGCWTFPEYDAQGRIIGLGLRWPTGNKGQLAGGRRGLSFTTDWRELPDPIILVEGPSDVLAGRFVGLNVIGRPSNSGGTSLLIHACRNRQVIILGENDRKADGSWPGKEGAEAVARKLETAWNRPVPVAFPPPEFKDLREWVLGVDGGFEDADTKAIRAAILSDIEPPGLVWLAGPRDKRDRVSLKVFRWIEGPDAVPIHSDRVNPDQESNRKRFAKALAKVEPQADVDQIAQQIIALSTQPDHHGNTRPKRPIVGGDYAATSSGERGDLPVVLLPGGPVPIQESAEQLGKLLAPGERYFVRGGAIVTVSTDEAGQPILETVKPAALASAFETVAALTTFGNSEGELVQRPAVCTEQQAKLIHYCEAFQHALPPLRLLSACPVVIERDDSFVQICGYDPVTGIMASSTPTEYVPLDEATQLIGEMLGDFRFASAADRARAIAAIITPALIMGGLLGGRAPVDLGEADDSQSGKGYRNKLTAAIYNQSVRAVTQKKGGVGSLEETFSTALIRGRNFISLDNMRGQIDSPAIESFLTEDSFLARAPHQAAVEIDPRRVMVQMTSNKADITIDLANRSSCVRILKQPTGYRFREYTEGDILDHVRANQPRFLGAVFAVVRAWHHAGKPRTKETGHDFRHWARTLDWIVQNVFHAGPLLEGHRETQVRMATPALNWLRDVALAVRDADQLDTWLRASQLVDILVETPVDLPGLPDGGDAEDDEVRKKILQAIGRRLRPCFRRDSRIVIDGIEIERREEEDPGNRRTNREYCFRASQSTPDKCAYAPSPHRSVIGADEVVDGAEDGPVAPDDTDHDRANPDCAYGAPKAAPIDPPNGMGVAPNAPKGHVIQMREDSVLHTVCINSDKYRKEKESIGAIGAPGAGDDGQPPADEPLISEPIYIPNTAVESAHWCTKSEHSDVSPTVIELARERDGWTPSSWHNRLLQQASACAGNHPERAAEFRQAADLMTNHRGASE